jgi:uncharacterized membrane protein YuzA (DUF378 family)
MKALDVICWLLLVIGGLNWGLVGIFEFNLVSWIFGGNDAVLSRIVYIIVAVAALYNLFLWQSIHVRWVRGSAPATA